MGKDPDAIRREIEETRAQMDETVEAIGYKADVPARAKDSVSRKVDSVRSTVSDTASRIGGTVRGTTSRAGDTAPSGQDVKQTARKAVGIAQENPLGLAVGAAAIGFLAGLVFPSTRVEDERLGPLADQVKDKAKETGQEALERGKGVAQQAVQSATETVKEQGRQHGQELADSARQSAQDVQRSAKQS
jgi:gas vesicle protein